MDYVYDISDPGLYGSANNRLMYYKTWDTSNAGGTGDVLLSQTYYYYVCNGNVTNVVTKTMNPEPQQPEFTNTRLAYAFNWQAVTFVLGEQWNGEVNPTGYQLNYAREFRYDGARAKYLNRELDTDDLLQTPYPWYTSLSQTWSDYDGDDIYGDFNASGSSFIEEAAYLHGIGRILDLAGTPTTGYYHWNQIGTTGTVSDSGGAHTAFRTNTAFGEPIAGTSDRFGYAGAWGYQNTLSGGSPLFPFQHVGARYYDPASGRFLQRDPIGIFGGLNVYAYVRNAPTIAVDPDGLIGFGGTIGAEMRRDFPNGYPKPKPRPSPGESREDIQRQLRKQRIIIQACIWGIAGVLGIAVGVAIGGTTGAVVGAATGGIVGGGGGAAAG